MHIVTAKDLHQQSFATIDLGKPFTALLGEIEAHASGLVHGPKGSGKSTFTADLAGALAQHGTVLIVSAEEGPGLTMQDKLSRVGVTGGAVLVSDYQGLDALKAAIKSHAVRFVILDSISAVGINTKRAVDFIRHCHGQRIGLWFVAHALKDGSSYKGDSKVGHEVYIEVQVTDGVARTIKNRYNELAEMPVRFEVKKRANPVCTPAQASMSKQPKHCKAMFAKGGGGGRSASPKKAKKSAKPKRAKVKSTKAKRGKTKQATRRDAEPKPTTSTAGRATDGMIDRGLARIEELLTEATHG